MIKLRKVIATDVDGVIKPYYDPVPRELSELLIKLSQKVIIIFLSGRQISWLDGLINGMGLDLKRTILIGEEGAVILFPKDYSLVYSIKGDYLDSFMRVREDIRRNLLARFGTSVFIPATHIILTVAAGNKFNDVDLFIRNLIQKKSYDEIINLTYHRMHNVIQIFPKGINKYVALRIALDKLSVSDDEVIALGDGVNDIPILRRAGLSIAIGDNREVKAVSKIHFSSGLSAFKYILSNLDKL